MPPWLNERLHVPTITVISTRQKLTTQSSTEAKLVAVDDCMSLILWTRCFLKAQGYGVDDVIIYQDNKSAILLEQNGRDRIPSTTPGAEPPRDAKDSGSARSHSTHLETSSSDRP